MSNNTVSQVSVQEYVEGLRSGNGGYTKQGLRKLNWCGQDLQGCDLRGLDLHGLKIIGANLKGANLCDANLSGADLSEADLSGAYLRGANLRAADLSEANLRGADLRGADLWGANLSEANLRGTELSWADLSEAYLRGANLRAADLRAADLSEANLSGANLSGADLSCANLSEAILDWDEIPLVPNIDAAVLEAIEAGGKLEMETWHTCKTTHCRAGWVITIAGEDGKALEEQLGTNAAAALIYARSGSHPVPNWYASTETALEDIKYRAEQQLAASQLISLEEKGIEIG